MFKHGGLGLYNLFTFLVLVLFMLVHMFGSFLCSARINNEINESYFFIKNSKLAHQLSTWLSKNVKFILENKIFQSFIKKIEENFACFSPKLSYFHIFLYNF